MTMAPRALVQALHRALEAGKTGDELRPLFTEDAKTIEHPNLVKPRGAVSNLAQMLANSEAGGKLLAKQSYEVTHETEQGNFVICRLRWTGVLAKTVGPFQEGQILKAHIAQFIETRDGRIASIETYDCYEPFS